MKTFILCLVALFCVVALTSALPTPNHIMLHDGHRLTFGHDECRKAVKVIIQQQMEDQLRKKQQSAATTEPVVDPVENNNDDEASSTTTTPALDEDMPLFTFLDALTWINITDIAVKDWDVRECTIYRDIHGWRIDANGVSVKAEASWSYAFEPNAPAITDHGKLDLFVENANVDAIILAHGDDDDDSSDSQEEKKDTANNNDDNVIDNLEELYQYVDEVDHYTAHVVTFIHNMTLTFRETDYADFYNKMAAEHNEALKWAVSIGANIYLSAALTHYLNPDLVEFQQILLNNEFVPDKKGLSPPTLTKPYVPQHQNRLMELGLMFNSLVPTEVESPKDILKLAHGGDEEQHDSPTRDDDKKEEEEHHHDEEAPHLEDTTSSATTTTAPA